jgi:hypothetical protein
MAACQVLRMLSQPELVCVLIESLEQVSDILKVSCNRLD